MRVTLYLSDKQREQQLNRALTAGFLKHGDKVQTISLADYAGPRDDTDLAVLVGVKSRKKYQELEKAHKLLMLIDKSYFGRGSYYRFALGSYQPMYLGSMTADSRRLKAMGVELVPKRSGGRHIIFAGSSQKYCDWHGLGDANVYAQMICAKIRKHLPRNMQLIYRPKPSWWANGVEGKVVPEGTTFSGPQEVLHRLLPRCHCLVTHGSNSAVEAIAAGVPVLLTSEVGVSPVWPLAEHEFEKLHRPFFPDDDDREKLLSNLAWCQFSVAEITSGLAWATARRWINPKG